jgi:CheY-like chemotaxis protein
VKNRILLVEDTPSIAKLAGDLLRSRGYEVTIASSSEEVLRAVEEKPPHLILMDVQIPGTDGLTLTRQLRNLPGLEKTVILAFTAFAMKEDEKKALEAGCNGYISKPIQIAPFVSTIESYLKGESIRAPKPSRKGKAPKASPTPAPKVNKKQEAGAR